jgi:hypothetical protein
MACSGTASFFFLPNKGLFRILSLQTKRPEYLLHVGTKMYVRKDVNLRPRFSKILQSFYNASIQKIDFDQSTQAVQTVNSWVSEITNGRIKAMFSAGKHLTPALQKSAKVYSNSQYTFPKSVLCDFAYLIDLDAKRFTLHTESCNHSYLKV